MSIFVALITSLMVMLTGQLGYAQVVYIPETFALPSLANSDPNNPALYYHVSLCDQGTNGRKQVVLDIGLPSNPTWNTSSSYPFVTIQVSICKDTFTQQCVIATNYEWGIHPRGVASISWDIGNVTDYYIRAIAFNIATSFSMELTFVSGITPESLPWTTNSPFSGSQMSSPATLSQYWSAETEYTANTMGPALAFAIGYCDQGDNVAIAAIKGINVAIAAIVKANDYSLMDQWACPQSYKLEDCTTSNNAWYNPEIASFNLLSCPSNSNDNTGGIWVFVKGYGANVDLINTFTIHATPIHATPK